MKRVFHFKFGLANQLLGFLAIFIVLMGGFAGAFYIAAFNKVLPIYVYLSFQIIGYLIGGMVLYYAISKISPGNFANQNLTEETTEPVEPLETIAKGETVEPVETIATGGTDKTVKTVKTVEAVKTEINKMKSKNSSVVFLMNFLVAIGIVLLMKFTLPLLIEFNRDTKFFIAVGLSLIGILGLGICSLISWLIAHNSARHSQYIYYLIRGIKLYLSNIKFIIISTVSIILTLTIVSYIHFLLWPILFSTNFSPLLIAFYKMITLASIIGSMVLFLMKTINVIYSDKAQFESLKTSPVGYVIAGLFLATIVFVTIPRTDNIIEDEYEKIITNAENFRSEGNLYLCGNEYKKAYALMKAYNGYLLDMQVQKDKKATEEQVKRVIGEADVLFRQAYEFYPNAGKIYYLDALRNIERNKSSALSMLLNTMKYDPDFHEAQLLILALRKDLGQEDSIRNDAESLIANEVYVDAGNLNKMSFNKIGKALDTVVDYNQVCLENITTIAYDYYNNQLYSESMNELQIIKEILPDDVVTNYLIAMTDLELKYDNKEYTTAIEAALNILDQYPNEKWAQDLYVGVTLRAGNQNVLEATLKEAYKKNPKDLDIAEQYAYSILKKNYNSSYYELTQQAEEVVDKILEIESERWFAIYCKSLIELYKGECEASLNNINKFADLIIEDKSLFSIYDELYNTYVLKYARRMVIDTVAREVLNSSESVDAFTYNYVMGAFGTMSDEVDTEGIINYLSQAIAYNSAFSKLYYMIGNAHMEYGYQQEDQQSYENAEEYYIKSIQIFESDPYAWFALGHAYKNQARFEEAMGAFQKTLTLMPTEDHQTDYFGVSIHSTLQIAELEGILSKEGQ